MLFTLPTEILFKIFEFMDHESIYLLYQTYYIDYNTLIKYYYDPNKHHILKDLLTYLIIVNADKLEYKDDKIKYIIKKYFNINWGLAFSSINNLNKYYSTLIIKYVKYKKINKIFNYTNYLGLSDPFETKNHTNLMLYISDKMFKLCNNDDVIYYFINEYFPFCDSLLKLLLEFTKNVTLSKIKILYNIANIKNNRENNTKKWIINCCYVNSIKNELERNKIILFIIDKHINNNDFILSDFIKTKNIIPIVQGMYPNLTQNEIIDYLN